MSPIRTDGTNAFSRYSMEKRVPRIARDTVLRNASAAPSVLRAIEALACAIEDSAEIPPPRAPGPDAGAWQRAFEAHPGERWLAAEWFYAELAFYREMVGASRFWETGRDPFEPFKEEEIAGDRLWSRLERAQSLPRGSREERVAQLLDACLWANRVDLSYSVAASRDQAHAADLLVDDRAAAAPILARDGAEVHVVADNAGTELALDLVLTDAILEAPSSRVCMHLKIEPTFVSDAMPRDVWRFCEALDARPGEPGGLASRLRAAFDAGRFVLLPDAFWSGPFFLSAAPPHIGTALASATMVVFKGDANYRRVVGDALWPPAEDFSAACSGLKYPLLCLRTMKSDAILGLPPGLADRLDQEDPQWRVDGRRGVAQAFFPTGNVPSFDG
jgi:hypothetical protein